MFLGRRDGRLISVVTLVAASLIIVATAEAAVQGVLTKRRVNEFEASAGRSGGNRYLAWTQAPGARPSRTKVMARRNGNTFRVSRRGTRAYAGGISGRTLIYQEIRRGSSNIFGFNLNTRRRSSYGAVNTRWWEYSPTKSGRWALFSRDKNRTRSVILLNLRNRNTRQLAEVARRGSRQAVAGQVNGKYAVYHKCTPNGCDVFRYNIRTRNKIRLPSPRFSQYFPSVARDGDVYYASSGAACGARVKILRWHEGNPRQIAFLGRKDTFQTYVAPAPGARVDVYFSKFRCNRDGSDMARRPRANVYKARVN